MSPLVLRLHDDHRFLLQLLGGATLAPIEERRIRLVYARSALVVHLARERAAIYPMLEANGPTTELSSRFGADIDRIAPRVMLILERLIERPDAEEVPYILLQLIDALRERIVAEEDELYPAFEEVEISANEPAPVEAEEEDESHAA